MTSFVHHFVSRLKKQVSSNKILIENFSYLSVLQFFNLLVPLIVYPYLIRVLGKEIYGLVVLAQAFIAYLLVLITFGFNISATKEVSIHRDNKARLNEIVSSVLIIKGLLLFLSFIILGILLLIIPQAQGNRLLLMLSMSACLSDILFPVWYFQGIEKMKYITIITLFGRLIFLLLIFMLIRHSDDYLLVPVIYGISYLVSGIIALYYIFVNHNLKFYRQSLQTLKKYFVGAFPIFISNLSVSLYVSTNKVIAGSFLGLSEVAYYDLAEKLTSVLKIPQTVLSQSIFPKISKERNRGFIKKIFRISVIANICLFILMVIFSKYIILILGGPQMLPAVVVTNILALTIPIISISNIFGFQLLIPFGYSKAFSQVIVISGIFYLLQLFLVGLTIGFSIISISVVTIITEVFVSFYMLYFCKRYYLWE